MRLTHALFIATVIVTSASAARAEEADTVQLPQEWMHYSSEGQTAEPGSRQWWTRFEDPMLDSLIDLGLRNNYDVRMATRRIAMARAAVGSARAGYYPVIGVNAGYTATHTAGATSSPAGPSEKLNYFGLSATMSWEIDIFGRVKANVDAGKRQLDISRAERAGIEVSLAAEIATTYINLRVQQAQLAVARQHSESQHKALKIAEARFETGLASMMDVDQARQVYYSTIASVPVLESNIHNDITSLATLLGVAPGEVSGTLSVPREMPSYIQLVAAGVPADLLRNRPDVIEAEKEIELYATKLGIARKDWLPTLSLQASAGTEAHSARKLFGDGSFTYTVAPTLSWTVFDGFARKYNIVSAREQLHSAVDNYNFTLLTAVQEADNALSTYFSYVKYIKALDDVVGAAKEYDFRALDNYKNGLSPYINVANAQMSYLEDMNTLIVAKGNALNALVSLYKAIGGGWTDEEM